MKIAAFIGRRVLRVVLCLIAVSVLTWMLLQLAPGDFSTIRSVGAGSVGLAQSATTDHVAAVEARYGEDVPSWQQYLTFMSGVVTGDMGPTYRYPHLTVEQIILRGFPISAGLALGATLIAVVVAVPVGILAAVRRKTVWDSGSMFVVTLGHGLPNYLTGLVLVLVFSSALQLLPPFGWNGPQNIIMPMLALSASPIAMLARYVRNSVLENLREEYVVAARARGGRFRVIMNRHVLRNSLMPLVTVLGPMFAALATGTIFVESLFGVPGLGRYFTEAATQRDMPLLMGSTLFFAALLMTMNLLVDLTYAALDPRVRANLGLARAVEEKPDAEEEPTVPDAVARSAPAQGGAL